MKLTSKTMSWLIFSFLFLAVTSLFAEESVLIKKVTVKGTKRVLGVVIQDTLKLKVGEPFDPKLVAEDVKAIYKMGEFSDVSIATAEVEEGIELILTVVESPSVSKVVFQGAKNFKDLADKISLKEKATFTHLKMKLSEKALIEFYKKEGYYGTKVESTVSEIAPSDVKVTFTIDEGQKLSVEKVTVICKAFSSDRLKGEMKTGEPGLLSSTNFDQKVFEEDLQRIVEFARQEGHDKARIVTSKIQPDPVRQKVNITVEVDEGPLFKVGTVELTLRELEADTRAKLMDGLAIRVGKRFNYKEVEDDRRRLGKYFADRGYIFANVVPSVQHREDVQLVDIIFTVNEGRVAYIEEVLIQGNLETKEKVIRRELEVQTGDQVDLSKIYRSQEKVWNLGFFDEPPRFEFLPGGKEDRLKLLFTVKERQNTGELSLGAGFSVIDGFTGTFSVTKHNFMGNGQRISASAEYGGFRRAVDVSFLEPWLFDSDTSFSIGGFYSQRAYFTDYKELSYGTNVRLGHSLDKEKFWRLWTSYRLAFTDIFDVATTASREIQNSRGERTVSSVPLELVFDSRDSIFFNTTKGARYSLGVEVAGLGGNLFFNRHIFDASLYLQTIPQWVVAFHTRMGYVTGYGSTPNVPFFERFFMGGTDTVRGYAERSVGPVDSTGFAVGGRLSWVANLEYRIPIVERVFYLVSFMDVGGLWDRAEDARVEDLASGAGLGIRVVIPNTTLIIRLDYGFGFNPKFGSPAGRPHFNFGSIF